MLEFVDAASGTGETNGVGLSGSLVNAITINPLVDAEAGDLLLLFFVVYNVSGEPATLTLPDQWMQYDVHTNGALRTFTLVKYATDAEPAGYDFVYSADRLVAFALLAYRGAQRDFAFDPTNFPFGYFAPGGSLGAVVTGSGNALTQVTGGHPTTVPTYATVITCFAQEDAAATPELDDVSPLVAMRTAIRAARIALQVVERTYATATPTVATLTVRSSLSDPFVVVSVPVEARDTAAASLDSYKAKVLRGMWPSPPYDTRLKSSLGKFLTVIGGSDNDVGGLFGSADFLPDEPLE